MKAYRLQLIAKVTVHAEIDVSAPSLEAAREKVLEEMHPSEFDWSLDDDFEGLEAIWARRVRNHPADRIHRQQLHELNRAERLSARATNDQRPTTKDSSC